jgi:threonylcarbamoyladenosine tRNA methylthiotransferase MtaB
MTGFPGETDAEFAETLRFVEDLPFTYLHVFTYSERPGTRAAGWEGGVPWEVRRERTRVLRELGEAKNRGFRLRQVGGELSVVTLGGTEAISSNFIPVRMAQEHPPQQIRPVRVASLTESGVAEAAILPVLAGSGSV